MSSREKKPATRDERLAITERSQIGQPLIGINGSEINRPGADLAVRFLAG